MRRLFLLKSFCFFSVILIIINLLRANPEELNTESALD